MSVHLLAIDPQNDFCDLPAEGAAAPTLPVPGAHADMQRLAALLRMQGGRIGKIGELRRKIAGGEGHELNALLPAPGQIRLDEFARRRCQRRRGFRRKPQRQQQPLRAAQQRLDAAG